MSEPPSANFHPLAMRTVEISQDCSVAALFSQVYFPERLENDPPASYFFSTGYFARNHSFHPPLSTLTFAYPADMNSRATRALVYSLGQAQ